ncbi:putative acyl-CoA-binding protein [Erysiphe neolycopersici]|uniref:Putative acyl-CoA-binding protein n=1 Tax=Erysiphe neolycopersici TaxID=212602 RepID=A0A420HKR4_9PEZI|nr:putative acyl-CoA-binding protein [Erysiphe neolycopersici]
MATSEAFTKAAIDSTKLTVKPNSDQLLDLYALYKIATGENIAEAPEPGRFDFKGNSKRKAWKAKVDTGITREKAEADYIALVEKFKVDYKYDPNKVSESFGG